VIDIVRETTASTTGNDLTVKAGGAVSGGTNLNGGNLNLSSGISTGTGTSGINFKVYGAGTSGTTDNTATTAMVITGAGIVGIGTTLPTDVVHVYSGGNAGVTVQGTNPTYGPWLKLLNSGTGGHTWYMVSGGTSENVGLGGLEFYDGTAGATRLVINASGNVGISTASPGDVLHVSGGGDAGVAVQGTSAVKGPWLKLTNSGASGRPWYLISDSSGNSGGSGALEIYDGTAGASRLIINTSGAVGLGTTSPRGGSTLDVNGKVYVATFAANSSTTVCQNANVLSTCTSARRYKEKIEPSQLGLKEVLAMKPVTFDLKDHKDNWERHDFGFIAEDMEAINPLFVTYDEDDEVSGMRYMQLTAVNTKAIQELHGKELEDVKELHEEIDRLKRTIEQLTHQH